MTTSNNVTLSPSGADIDTPVSSAPSAIPVDTLGQSTATPPAVLPAPTPTDLSHVVTSGSSAITGNNSVLTPPVPTDNPSDTSPAPTAPTVPTWLSSLLTSVNPPTNGASTYANDESGANINGLQTKANSDQQAVVDATTNLNNLNAQLKVYSDKATQIPIQDQQDALGKGITTAGNAPLDASQLRENALASIPLQASVLGAQASLAAAQGNAALSASILAQAQQQVDKVFSIQQTDATNQFNYQQSLISTYYSYASTEQQNQLDALKTTQAQQYQTQQNNLNAGQQMAATAISSGQADIAGKITALDPTSSTYTADLGKLEAQIVPKATAATETYSTPFTDSNGNYVQLSSTGEVHVINPTTTPGGSANPMPYTSSYGSSSEYVNAVLSKQGVSYNSAQANTPPGTVSAIDNQTGQTVIIDSKDWNANSGAIRPQYTVIYNHL